MKTMTAKEYLKAPETAAKAVRELTAFTLQDIREYVTKTSPYLIRNMLTPVIRNEDLDERKLSQMDYLDLLCIIDNMEGNVRYRGGYEDTEDGGTEGYSSDDEYLYHVYLLQTLLQILRNKYSGINLLFKVPYRSICRELERHRNIAAVTHCHAELLRQFCDAGWIKCVSGNETLEEILMICNEEIKKRWIPTVSSPDAYAARIRGMIDFMAHSLIDPFRLAYPERFHIEDVRGKFRKDLPCDIDDDLEIDPECPFD